MISIIGKNQLIFVTNIKEQGKCKVGQSWKNVSLTTSSDNCAVIWNYMEFTTIFTATWFSITIAVSFGTGCSYARKGL